MTRPLSPKTQRRIAAGVKKYLSQSTSVLVWFDAEKKKPSLKRGRISVTIPANRHLSTTANLDVRDSAPIIMRWKEPPTHQNGEFKMVPNPRAGQFNYTIGLYRRYDDGEKGFECERGHEHSPDQWAYLPEVADYRK